MEVRETKDSQVGSRVRVSKSISGGPCRTRGVGVGSGMRVVGGRGGGSTGVVWVWGGSRVPDV